MKPKYNYLPTPLIGVLCCFWLAVPAHAEQVDLMTYSKYRYQHDDSGTDNDFSLYADLSVTDLIAKRLDLRVMGWLNASMTNTGSEAVSDDASRVSQAYLRLKCADQRYNLYLGRQYLDKIDNFAVDGALLDFSPKQWQLQLFAGLPVSFYDGTAGDRMGGGSITYKPWWRTTIELNGYLLLDDDNSYDVMAMKINQYLPVLNSRAYFRPRAVNGDLRDLYFTVNSFCERTNTALNFSYFVQPDAHGQGEEATSFAFSSLGQILNTTYGYQRTSLDAQVFLTEHLFLYGGLTYKRVLDTVQEYEWSNVDSDVITFGFTLVDLISTGLDLSILGNYVENDEDRFHDLTGEVEYAFTEKFSAGAGMTYTGYSFGDVQYSDTYNGQLSSYDLDDHIGSKIYFMDLQYRFNKNQRLKLSMAYEDMDEKYDNSVQARLAYQYRFSMKR